MNKAFAAVAIAFLPQHLWAQGTNVLDFLEVNGCVVGPETNSAAVNANIDPNAVAEFVADLGPSDVTEQGDWQVLSGDVCIIGLPSITADLSHSDPVVQAAWSAPNEYLEELGDAGCYLDTIALTNGLIITRGMSEAEAFNAYLGYLATGILSGDIRFYGDDALRTPIGPRLLIGDCAVGDDLVAVTKNHEVLRAAFAPYLRTVAPDTVCGADHTTMSVWPQPDIEELTGLENTNAHLGFEIFLITLGAGWIERDVTDFRDRGTVRPPLCHYLE